jgi:hypothetical protein
VHGLVTLFLEVITLVIILFVVGLAVPCVLVITSTTIIALIVSMTIIRSAIIAVALVTLMMVAVVATAMLAVAQLMATCGRKMSRFFSFGCFLSFTEVPDALVEGCLCLICIVWTLFWDDAGTLCQAHILKALTQEAKQRWTIVFLCIQESSQNL